MFQEHNHASGKDTAPCRPCRRRSVEDMQGCIQISALDLEVEQPELHSVVSETDSPVRKERRIERPGSGEQIPASLLDLSSTNTSAPLQPHHSRDLSDVLAQATSITTSSLDLTIHSGAATSALRSLSPTRPPKRKKSKHGHHGGCHRHHSYPHQALPTINEFQKFSGPSTLQRRRQSLRSYTKLLSAMTLTSSSSSSNSEGNSLANVMDQSTVDVGEQQPPVMVSNEELFPEIAWQEDEE